MIEIIYQNKIFVMQKEQYSILYQKGFGHKEDNEFFLTSYEALYLQKKNKIQVFLNKKDLTFKEILKKTKVEYKKYLVYENLRNEGYIPKSGLKYGFDFRIYKKGKKPYQEHSSWLLDIYYTNSKIDNKIILSKNRVAHSTNKKMILAIIDDELSITYIENLWKKF